MFHDNITIICIDQNKQLIQYLLIHFESINIPNIIYVINNINHNMFNNNNVCINKKSRTLCIKTSRY